MAQTIHIAMLNADVPLGAVLPKWGTYGNIFHHLISSAASRISPNLKIKSTNYDVTNGEYPSCLDDIHALLITGSAASAYDNEAWIKKLEDYVRDVYANFPAVKIFGSCFGHQLISQGLLKESGVVVEKDPNGWELGVKEMVLNDEFQKTLGKTAHLANGETPTISVPKTLRLQFVHADHVRLPPSGALPGDWQSIGRSEHCANQGIYQPGRVFTFQGHFEFDSFINTEVIKVFGANWEPKALQETLETIDKDDDAEVAAELVVKFLLEEAVTKNGSTHAVTGGLLTPPLQE
ncbi:class I glutamine amidotransferase-like protein [Corynespora cassiicola Philippines]|uniref:Class I glutamine amidotransferase-like protein n=1 Tax=Corynespora cassiicola Philippines TaxID=1448308 RepID=A0A2T2NLE5_CORCC|nr:class I glutamine amidotransferase-like protein [Corynespora cassiicola Philippines]